MIVRASEQVYTPRVVGEMLCAHARLDVPGLSILEPHIGHGHLASVIREQMTPDSRLYGYDTDPEAVAAARAAGFDARVCDFLTTPHWLDYDRIIASPPFTDGIDEQHVRHMYWCLKKGGRLVSTMHAGRARTPGTPAAFLLHQMRAEVYDLPPRSFVEGGSSVDAVVVVIDAGNMRRSRRELSGEM